MIRGSRDGFPLLDGMIDVNAYEDSVFVDSIEVLKGPAGVLYAGTSLTGTIIKTTMPLQTQQTVVTAKIVSFGTFRGTLDDRPAGTLVTSESALPPGRGLQGGAMRILIIISGTSPRSIPRSSSITRTPEVLFALDEQKILAPGNGNGILTPNGNSYTGWL